ncbi:MAG: CPBP family glutamic-type intramembrane protease [Rothia sp. (in: high G+C Gram-positive bacteria)]|uniref:CPBP family intramembrane glutamic endopeptidase n=1 Tax=Rothia sp. (in: high G+C Gram-positive bacteria) TaxID=1885016 RepID=UPI0026DFE4D6|nr:CPBP family glutamic-type intramembrane protease [Rothia sp. (in: high G+C Gram-positive bacteria)]MDO5750468.1 CPBP family glutamic-type intramembrane protease [Rothia sp. (in: high G+C Gram-positive bacteria)]
MTQNIPEPPQNTQHTAPPSAEPYAEYEQNAASAIQSAPADPAVNFASPAPAAPLYPVVPARDIPGEYTYDQLERSDIRVKWYKPLLELLVGGGLALAATIVLQIVLSMYLALSYHASNLSTESDKLTAYIQTQTLIDPMVMALSFGSIAALSPALILGRWIFGARPWGLLHSVTGRMRWGLLGRSLGLSFTIYGLFYLITSAMDSFAGFGQINEQVDAGRFIAFIALMIFLVPLQCYAEEVAFRGYAMQILGRWIKNPVIIISIPAVLFMLGHDYDFWGQAGVLTMGLMAGFLCYYTGGIEAGVGLHVGNNVLVMFMGLIASQDPFAQAGTSFLDFALTFSIEALYTLIMCIWARKAGFGSRRIIQAPQVVAESV